MIVLASRWTALAKTCFDSRNDARVARRAAAKRVDHFHRRPNGVGARARTVVRAVGNHVVALRAIAGAAAVVVRLAALIDARAVVWRAPVAVVDAIRFVDVGRGTPARAAVVSAIVKRESDGRSKKEAKNHFSSLARDALQTRAPKTKAFPSITRVQREKLFIPTFLFLGAQTQRQKTMSAQRKQEEQQFPLVFRSSFATNAPKIDRRKKRRAAEGDDALLSTKPVLASWHTVSAHFDPKAVHKKPSPNQHKTNMQLGDGVVAGRDFKAGDILCSYGGKVLSKVEHDALVAKHQSHCPRVTYLIGLNEDEEQKGKAEELWYLDGHPSGIESIGHVGQYINDARGITDCSPNCKILIHDLEGKDAVYIVAERDIKAGEELFLSYGERYWLDDEELRTRCAGKCIV